MYEQQTDAPLQEKREAPWIILSNFAYLKRILKLLCSMAYIKALLATSKLSVDLCNCRRQSELCKSLVPLYLNVRWNFSTT